VLPGILADLVLVVHGLYVGFVVIGFALILLGIARGWPWVRRPGFRYTHLAAIGFVVLQVWIGMECPLTTWKAPCDLRRRSRVWHVLYPALAVSAAVRPGRQPRVCHYLLAVRGCRGARLVVCPAGSPAVAA
jgi:hypothetical protein